MFSEDTDVHGCIVGNGTSSWATPDFERLGLLEKLSTRDVGPEFGLPYPISNLLNLSLLLLSLLLLLLLLMLLQWP